MKIVYTLALVAFSLRLAAQTNVPVLSNTPTLSNDKLFYAQKVEKYKRMKTTGIVMIVAGTVLSIAGIANLSSADYTTTTNQYGQSQQTSNDPKVVSGLLMFIGGTGLLGGGIPLTIVGSKQSQKWQRKLDGLTFNFKLTPNQQGLALVYKF